MKLKECKDAYYEFSGKLSDNCRKLAFAGIAIVWIFKKEDGAIFTLSAELTRTSFFLVLCLCFDILQYSYQTIIWGFYHRYKEKEKSDPEREFLAPRWINWPAIIIMWAKVACVIIAYVFIFLFMFSKFEFS